MERYGVIKLYHFNPELFIRIDNLVKSSVIPAHRHYISNKANPDSSATLLLSSFWISPFQGHDSPWLYFVVPAHVGIQVESPC